MHARIRVLTFYIHLKAEPGNAWNVSEVIP